MADETRLTPVGEPTTEFPPVDAPGFPSGTVVSAPILAVLVPRIQEIAERDGQSALAVVNAALMAGLAMLGASPCPEAYH